jgi:hypothetical protein
MLLNSRSLTAWTVVNIAASAAFCWLASWTWLEPNLRGEEVARGGDAIVWMLSAFPVLAVSAAANAVWLALIWRERRQKRGSWPGAAITVIAAIWISALFVDHFRGLGF